MRYLRPGMGTSFTPPPSGAAGPPVCGPESVANQLVGRGGLAFQLAELSPAERLRIYCDAIQGGVKSAAAARKLRWALEVNRSGSLVGPLTGQLELMESQSRNLRLLADLVMRVEAGPRCLSRELPACQGEERPDPTVDGLGLAFLAFIPLFKLLVVVAGGVLAVEAITSLTQVISTTRANEIQSNFANRVADAVTACFESGLSADACNQRARSLMLAKPDIVLPGGSSVGLFWPAVVGLAIWQRKRIGALWTSLFSRR